MIAWLIRWCARNPWFTVAITLFCVLITWARLPRLSLDALPDLSDTQVIVQANWPGRSPSLVEDQLTYPLVTGLLSTPKVRYVRGVSMVGTGQITVVFEDGVDLYWARSRILEKISTVGNLPEGVIPQMGPEATGLGWVYQYALVDRTGQMDLAQLRSLQNWTIRYAVQSVPGVAEVATVGGFEREYQIQLNPTRLRAYGISPLEVNRAIRGGNDEIGAQVIEMGGAEFVVRGRGYVKSVEDILQIPVVSRKNAEIIRIRDIAEVQMGPAPRRGAAEFNGEGETVSGVVVMRVGENALKVIEGAKKKLQEVAASLPQGVEIVPVYDRSRLIERAFDTLRRVLVEEIAIVALIVSLFLWHARSSWVCIIPLPIAVFLSFLPMVQTGLTVNIMSLGGIALAIGAMVDSGIILVENASKRLEGKNTREMAEKDRRHLITEAMVQMGKPLFFSLMVITVSFLPIFALEGREGKLFHPLAYTKTVSMALGAVLAITLTPALAVLFLKGRFLQEERHVVSRFLHRLYTPVIRFVLRHSALTVVAAGALVLATVPVFISLRSEFMPPLNEGTVLYMPTAAAGMSVDTAVQILQKQDALIRSVPEVQTVLGKAGRTDSATDPAPLNMFETVIELKPSEQWRDGSTYQSIIAELDSKLDFPGMPNIWWMPIQTRIEMLSTGVRSTLGIKILGSDLHAQQQVALDIEDTLRTLSGTRTVFAERPESGSFVDIVVRRSQAALYGLNVRDVHEVIETAVGGNVATQTVEGRERYAVRVRYAADFRQDLEALSSVVVPVPGQREVRLGDIADLSVSQGAPMIQSENGKILSLVFIELKPDEGISEYVERARAAIAENVQLPVGVQLVFSGQYEAVESAWSVLRYVIPLTLFVILLLLYINTRSFAETGIVLLAVPFSLIGAFVLMWALGYKLSIASWVGLIALAGLDAETGVVMLLYLTEAWKDKIRQAGAARPGLQQLYEAIYEGAVQRIRPKLMTVASTLLGLLPVMWSDGTGSEVMKRIAAPMVGGVITSALLELCVYPAIFAIWQRRNLARIPLES